MPKLSGDGRADNGPVQNDPRVNPDGIYSGMTKRLACTDGKFADVSNKTKDTRNRGRLS